MSVKKLYGYIFIGALAVGSVLLYFSAVSDITELPKRLEKEKQNEGSVLEKAVIWRQLKDGSKLKLQAATLERSTGKIDAVSVRVTLFRDSIPVYKALANRCLYNTAAKKLVLRGKVVLDELKQDVRLYTDELEWDTERGFISTSSSVKIVKKDGTELIGDMLKGNVSTEKWIVQGHVKITIQEGGG